jgi:hypothetical protein
MLQEFKWLQVAGTRTSPASPGRVARRSFRSSESGAAIPDSTGTGECAPTTPADARPWRQRSANLRSPRENSRASADAAGPLASAAPAPQKVRHALRSRRAGSLSRRTFRDARRPRRAAGRPPTGCLRCRFQREFRGFEDWRRKGDSNSRPNHYEFNFLAFRVFPERRKSLASAYRRNSSMEFSQPVRSLRSGIRTLPASAFASGPTEQCPTSSFIALEAGGRRRSGSSQLAPCDGSHRARRGASPRRRSDRWTTVVTQRRKTLRPARG